MVNVYLPIGQSTQLKQGNSLHKIAGSFTYKKTNPRAEYFTTEQPAGRIPKGAATPDPKGRNKCALNPVFTTYELH